MKYSFLLFLLFCIIPGIAQGNGQKIHKYYSFWDIVTIITRGIPVTEKVASQIPFIPNLENCVRCERKEYMTKDGMVIDILAFWTDKSIKELAITIGSQPKDICIPLSKVKKIYKFKDTDRYVDGLEGGDRFYGGYQVKNGNLRIVFLSEISTADHINFLDRCVKIISFSYDSK